jgi:hypothetical protein
MTIGTTAKKSRYGVSVSGDRNVQNQKRQERNDKERLEEERDDDNSSELINYNFIVSFGLTIYTHTHTLSMSHVIS